MKVQSTKTAAIDRLKLLIFGAYGTGKTTLASTIEKELKEKVLIISSEAGLLSLAGHDIDVIDISVDDKGEQIDRPKRMERLNEVFMWICQAEQKKKYSWIFVDSLTEISQNLVEALKELYPDRKDGLVLWGEYNTKMMGLIKTFRDLPYYNVVFTALEKVDKDQDNKRFMTVDINGKIASRMGALFDEVFWLSIFEDKEGKKVRKILTGAWDNVSAKDRSGKLDLFEDPDLGMIVKKIRATKQQPTGGKNEFS